MMEHLKRIIFLALVISISSCSSSSRESELNKLFPNSSSSVYFKSAVNFNLEVYYEAGAEPYVGNLPSTDPVWSIVEDNLSQILSYKSIMPSINVPNALNEMYEIPLNNKSTWSVSDVLSLYENNHLNESTTSDSNFYIYFLNGNAESSSSVIGFSINGTPIIAIFKDVIKGAGGTTTAKQYIEQSTVVHEIGHALGFVNNGVAMAVSHQDTEHGAHTLNTDCVMYWLNEGVSDLNAFLAGFILSNETLLWGPEVLADAEQFSE